MKSLKTLVTLTAGILLLTSCGGGSSTSGSSSSGPSSSEPTSTSEKSQYTPESVMKDLCTKLYGSATKGEDYYYDDEYDEFYTTAVTTDTTDLQQLAQLGVSYLPEYVTAGEPYSGEWSEGDAGYFVDCSVDTVFVAIGTYTYTDTESSTTYGCIQFETYSISN